MRLTSLGSLDPGEGWLRPVDACQVKVVAFSLCLVFDPAVYRYPRILGPVTEIGDVQAAAVIGIVKCSADTAGWKEGLLTGTDELGESESCER